jgi:hypothetical protein
LLSAQQQQQQQQQQQVYLSNYRKVANKEAEKEQAGLRNIISYYDSTMNAQY